MTLKAFNKVKIKFDLFDDLQWSKSSFRALKVFKHAKYNINVKLKAFNLIKQFIYIKLKGFNHYQKNISYLRRVNN